MQSCATTIPPAARRPNQASLASFLRDIGDHPGFCCCERIASTLISTTPFPEIAASPEFHPFGVWVRGKRRSDAMTGERPDALFREAGAAISEGLVLDASAVSATRDAATMAASIENSVMNRLLLFEAAPAPPRPTLTLLESLSVPRTDSPTSRETERPGAIAISGSNEPDSLDRSKIKAHPRKDVVCAC